MSAEIGGHSAGSTVQRAENYDSISSANGAIDDRWALAVAAANQTYSGSLSDK